MIAVVRPLLRSNLTGALTQNFDIKSHQEELFKPASILEEANHYSTEIYF